MRCVLVLIALCVVRIKIISFCDELNVLYAINCGGGEHTDADGIHYQADPLMVDNIYDANMYNSITNIRGVLNKEDKILYTTQYQPDIDQRYFGYDIPMDIYDNADFVLVMKFYDNLCLYPRDRVFDIYVNNDLPIFKGLDIVSSVGCYYIYDLHLPFTTDKGLLHINDQTTLIDEKIHVEFRNTNESMYDPVLSAMYLVRLNIFQLLHVKPLRIVFGVNVGGRQHTDVHGVYYRADSGAEMHEVSLAVGNIIGSPPFDQILYNTNRNEFVATNFDILLIDDGNYVIVLKFCEKSETAQIHNFGRNIKVILNDKHILLEHFDIYSDGGFYVALDKHIPFEVKNGTIIWNEEESRIKNNRVHLDIGGDRPTISALFVMMGNLSDVPVYKNDSFNNNTLNLPDTIPTIYAINVGGKEHVDVHGVLFNTDPFLGLDENGIATDYGNETRLFKVPKSDQILYSTERSSTECIKYDIQTIVESSTYVLVLKFCENVFNASNQRQMTIVINRNHTVVHKLDIFDLVGKNVAHDVHIPFSVDDGLFHYNGEESSLINGGIRIEICELGNGNSTLSAIYVMKGNIQILQMVKERSYLLRQEIPYAINCGGTHHTDIYGVHYNPDLIFKYPQNAHSTHSGAITAYNIHENDMYLIHTGRAPVNSTFSYNIPISADGEYAVVLMFKHDPDVFISLNGFETRFDAQSELAIATEKYFSFVIKNKTFVFEGVQSKLQHDYISVTIYSNNTDIFKSVLNAMFVIKANLDDFLCIRNRSSLSKVLIVYAVNAGGVDHVDVHGIRYEVDPFGGGDMMSNFEGLVYAETFNKISKVQLEDQILYQSGRMCLTDIFTLTPYNFSYYIPIDTNGHYVIVLKFCEISEYTYNNLSTIKVILNNNHTIVQNLNVFKEVGKFSALDKKIPIFVDNNTLYYNNESSIVKDNKIPITFNSSFELKCTDFLINAFFVMKGHLEDVPKIMEYNLTKTASKKKDNVIIHAFNVGGNEVVDSNGIHYEMDPLHFTNMGIEKSYKVGAGEEVDKYWQQTERTTKNKYFFYQLQVHGSGKYILVLRFFENAKMEPNERQFNVIINIFTVSTNLDISKKVGRNVPYNLYVPFLIDDNIFRFDGEECSLLPNTTIRVELYEGNRGKPFLNALLLFKGKRISQVRDMLNDKLKEDRKNASTSIKFSLLLNVFIFQLCTLMKL